MQVEPCKPPVDAASALRLKDIPVFAVPVGSPSRLPDLELLSLDAPTFGLVGKSVRNRDVIRMDSRSLSHTIFQGFGSLLRNTSEVLERLIIKQSHCCCRATQMPRPQSPTAR